MPFTYKAKEEASARRKNTKAPSEFETFFELAEAAVENDLNEEGIIELYHEMSKTKKESMSVEHAEDYIHALESINESAAGALKVYFQGDYEKESPLAHYKKSSDDTLAPTSGYYRFVPSDKHKAVEPSSRINISVKTSSLKRLSQVVSDLTLQQKNITQSKVVSPGGIENTAESAIIYFKPADVDYAEWIAKRIQQEIGLDSFVPTPMIGLKELQTGIGYKEISQGDTTSAAQSLAKVIRRAIKDEPNKKLKSAKFLREKLKHALECRGYERKNPALIFKGKK